MAQQTSTRRFYKCGEKPGTVGFGVAICFDVSYKTKNDRFIPLEEVTDSLAQKTLKIHNCPQKPKKDYNNNGTTTTGVAVVSPPHASPSSSELGSELRALQQILLTVNKRIETILQQKNL
jgi:hypothetical protein